MLICTRSHMLNAGNWCFIEYLCLWLKWFMTAFSRWFSLTLAAHWRLFENLLWVFYFCSVCMKCEKNLSFSLSWVFNILCIFPGWSYKLLNEVTWNFFCYRILWMFGVVVLSVVPFSWLLVFVMISFLISGAQVSRWWICVKCFAVLYACSVSGCNTMSTEVAAAIIILCIKIQFEFLDCSYSWIICSWTVYL